MKSTTADKMKSSSCLDRFSSIDHSSIVPESASAGHWKDYFRFGTVLMTLAILYGCSTQADGPERFDLAGAATYLGKPIPAGTIMFEPNFDKGNSGPGSYAVIQNGTYQTEPGKGVVGGPYLARIQGYDGMAYSNAEGLQEAGQPLFQEQVVYFEATKKNASQDLDVVVTDQKK